MNNKIKNTINFSTLIKAKAIEIGFSECGISKAEILSEYEEHLRDSIALGYNAGMNYLQYSLEKRLNPELVLKDAKSVISVLISYNTKDSLNKDSYYKIAKYAFGRDYHVVIKEKLLLLENYIKTLINDAKMKSFVDASGVLEKALASKSGLGSIGKNCILINKKWGSFCFIGEIIIDRELDYDKAIETDYCGSCNKCIEACPTKALVEPFVLDARKCISYNTIEKKSEVGSQKSENKNRWIYGCDICQDVCPWNKKALYSTENSFEINPELKNMTKDDWETLTEEKFDIIFKDSAVVRAKYTGLKRNIDSVVSRKY